MRDLLKYFKGYRKESVIAPLFKLLEASFELLVPLVMANIIDIGIKNNDITYILKMGGLMILLGVIGLTCSLTSQFFSAKASVGFGTALRTDLYKHINTLSYTELDNAGISSLITRMTSDTNQVQSGVNLFLRLFMRSPFIVFGAMVMAFTIDVKAAFMFVIVIPALSFVVFGIMLISMPLYKKVQMQLDKVLLLTRENLSGARVVRAFNRQEEEDRVFNDESGRLVAFQVFVGRISALMNPVTYVIINIGIICIIWTGGKQVDTGIIKQGEVVALVNYMSQILVELIKLANLIIAISKALACAGRVSAVLNMKSSISDTTGSMAASDIKYNDIKVEFRQAGLAYGKSKEESVSGITFSVKRGQTIGIIGGTGSGKSTVVNMIPRFYDATSGCVLVDGINVKDHELAALRKKIGVVPQKAVLFKGTIRENMLWGKEDASDKEIIKALDIAQTSEIVKEKGLDFEIYQGGKNLSGGQKQRLTIARALVKEPDILILDDSASALDFATDAALRKAIRENTDNMTVFIVSQRATTIKNADNILVLDDGRMEGFGKHDELMETCETYREICLSQISKEEAGYGQKQK